MIDENNIKVLISEEEISKKINELALKISNDYAGRDIHLICILKGSVFFSCELAKKITIPVTMDFMSVSSYSELVGSGRVKIVRILMSQLKQGCHNYKDIIDSGKNTCVLMITRYKITRV